MRIVLLHAPPWKIPRDGQRFEDREGPPPNAEHPQIRDGDFATIPYGLLSLAAQAKRAGKQADVYNLSTFPWDYVEQVLRTQPADLYGISCLTINRRGVMAVARLLRRLHPQAHIAVGGPHATALAQPLLERCTAIDTVVLGEGEATFLELIERLESGASLVGVSGTMCRDQQGIHAGPPSPPIEDLDALASPLDQFPSHIVVTSRGCPGQCTFCNSQAMWSRRVRFHSPEYVLDMLEKAVLTHRIPVLAIKDDTFTAHRPRALAICRGIQERGLKFVWSCDTRADSLDEELLRALRVAGCRMLSLGVESGSPQILATIKKRLRPSQVLETTRLAKRYGFQVRFYMMWGNRGENRDTIRESLDLIAAAQPNQVLFTLLSIYPGTEEFEVLRREGAVTEEFFFAEDFPTLKLFQGEARQFKDIQERVSRFERHIDFWRYGVEEYEEILSRLPDLPEAHLDLAAACCRAGKREQTEHHVREALERGYPLPGLAINVRGCLAASQGQFEQARRHFVEALQHYPHAIVQENLGVLTAWLSLGGPASGRPLLLRPDACFETCWPEQQPEKPVPFSGRWDTAMLAH